jgi:CubicO group peptidase (beta-lactamase class C family)
MRKKYFIPITLSLCFTIGFLGCKNGEDNKDEASTRKTVLKSTREYKSFSKQFLDSIKSFFPEHFSGTVLLYKNGKMYKHAFGYRDAGDTDKMQIDDVFQLASVSKTVTATATLILVEDRILNLDSSLDVYLPDFPYPNVTIRHLLCHQSGIPNYMYLTDRYWSDTAPCMSNADLYKFFCVKKPRAYANPGQTFYYNNSNYAILSYLIEQVSGKPFHQFVEERIFEPAGMSNSFYIGHKPESIQEKVIVGRYQDYVYEDAYYMDGILGDKGLYSNVEDLFRFHQALANKKILNDTLLNTIQEANHRFDSRGCSYGLGFRLRKGDSGQWTYHNGWWRGFWTSFWNRFDDKICVVVLTNNTYSSHVNKMEIAELLAQTK